MAIVAALATGLTQAADDVDYVREIKPLLAAKCTSCHGALKQESGLRLDAGSLIRKGGEQGPAIVPGDASGSHLYERVSSSDADERMPPEGEGEPLTPVQLDLLQRWIAAGAKFPDDEAIPPNPREHWAYQPPVRAIPQVSDASWTANPIDAFLSVKHAEHGLTPVAPAPKQVLLRRVYFDLIGLPPTREQLAAFLADDSPEAYAKVVDELLKSPQHGERWGRHWMDVWRYSDWSGYGNEIRYSQRHIWRWRDWIVESVNADKPYDRLVLEMLAGDELAPADASTLRATGFLARNWYKFNRNMWLDDAVEHTSKAFLGMTLACAKCHDHKYDPLAQEQYYQFRALFEPHDIRTDAIAGEPDLMKDGLPRAFDKDLAATTFLFVRGNEKQPAKDRPIAATVPELLGVPFQVEAVTLSAEAYYPALRGEQIEARLATARTEIDKARAEREKRNTENASPEVKAEAELHLQIAEASLKALEARVAADRAKYSGPAEKVPELAPLAAKAEGEAAVAQAKLAVHKAEQAHAAAMKQSQEKPDDGKLKKAVEESQKQLTEANKKLSDAQAALEKPSDKYTALGEEYPRTSSGRRLALAKWIADRRNPLTARVAINHIWLRHFGTPLVDNVFDFGLRSPRPRHAELLDWLAVELMESGWSMKHIHRLIVTSRTYQLSSSLKGAAEQSRQRDPDNAFYWHMNAHRLEAEAVRDSILHAAGNLDLAQGGPDIDQEQGQSSRRRSIYLRHAYEKKMKFLELFDAPSEADCYRRSESVVPQQALALANSQLALEQARLLAGRLMPVAQAATKEGEGVDAKFIGLAFQAILTREPSDDELKHCIEFLTDQAARLSKAGELSAISGGPAVSVAPSGDVKQRAREDLIHVLLNHNDFVTIR